MEQSKKPKTSSDESSASSEHKLRPEKMVEVKTEPVFSRKVDKAEREKIRRDKLNKQFLELGYALDPNRPKSDKASILIDTIQILKDLMTHVDRLKAEYVTLSQESLELIQEKSKLRGEKSSLKSDIKILNAQYQHRVRTMVPWIQQYAVSTLPFPLNGTQNRELVDYSAASLSPKTEQQDDVSLKLELKIHADSSSAQQDGSGKEKTTTAGSANSYSSSEAVQDSSPGEVKNILKS